MNQPPRERRFWLNPDRSTDSYVKYEGTSITMADCDRKITWWISAVRSSQTPAARRQAARQNIRKFRKVHQLLNELMEYWNSVLDE